MVGGRQLLGAVVAAWACLLPGGLPGVATARPLFRKACMRRKKFSPHFALFQPQAESGRSVSLLGHLAAMMGPPGGPGGVVVGYPPRTPAQTRVYAAPGDVPTRCPRGSRGYRSMVRVTIGSAIHRFLTLPLAPGATGHRPPRLLTMPHGADGLFFLWTSPNDAC